MVSTYSDTREAERRWSLGLWWPTSLVNLMSFKLIVDPASKEMKKTPKVSKHAHIYVHTYIKNSLVYSDMRPFAAKRKPTLS